METLQPLLVLVLLLIKSFVDVHSASVFGFPEDLFVDDIASCLPTEDLQILLATTPSMQRILSDLLVQRHSM